MKLFTFITVTQVLFIGMLCFYISARGYQTVVSPIQKETLGINEKSYLQFFYEPKQNTKEVVNDWGPYKGAYLINDDTLNERFEYTVVKPVTTYRIIALGDSYTYGLYVDTSSNWPEQLEDILNQQCSKYQKYEVINLGVHGYDLEYAAERYYLRGQKYNPDMILWFVKDDDLVQVNEVMFAELEKYKGDEKNYEAWNNAFEETVNKMGFEEMMKYQRNVLKKFFTNYSGDIGLVTFPNYKGFSSEVMTDFEKNNPRLFSVTVADIYENDRLFYKNDFHPTAEGHTVIASDVYDFFVEHNDLCH